jgi:hypothetical protein
VIAGIISGAFALLFLLIKAAIVLVCFAFWLWMLIHAITNKGLEGAEKVVWVIVIIFVPILGPILYFFLGRPKGEGAIG